MASVLALKRIFSSNLLPTYFRLAHHRPVTASPSATASRLFSTGSASSPGQEDGPRSVGRGRGWGAEETEESLYLRMGMPGLGKEDVDVFVEGRSVIVKGKGKNAVVDEIGDVCKREFTGRVELPEKVYRLDELRAMAKNGTLTIVVPKAKEFDKETH